MSNAENSRAFCQTLVNPSQRLKHAKTAPYAGPRDDISTRPPRRHFDQKPMENSKKPGRLRWTTKFHARITMGANVDLKIRAARGGRGILCPVPPAGPRPPVVKFRQNRGAPLALCQITVEFRQIPAAAAAPVETVKPVKSRQNPDRSRAPTLLKPYPSCSHSRTGGRWGAVRWWIRPGLGSERESRRSNTREDIASIACSLQCTDPLRKQKVKLLCIINYVVLRRGRKEVSKFRETASMTAPAPLSVQLCLTPSRW